MAMLFIISNTKSLKLLVCIARVSGISWNTLIPSKNQSVYCRMMTRQKYFCRWIFIGCLALIDCAKAFDCVDHNKLWKILKEMGIPDHLICLLRNLYASQEATVRTGHGTTDWFQIGKGVHQGCILSPCLFNLYAESIMWNTGLDEEQAGIKIARRNDTTVTVES